MTGLLWNFVSPDTLEEWKENVEWMCSCLQDRRFGMAGVALGTALLIYTTRKSITNQREIGLKQEALSNYPSLWNHSNLMAKNLTPDIYARLVNVKTRSGFSLDQAIQPGIDNPYHPHICITGIVAGDEESYQVFAELFDRIIEERHNGYKRTSMHVTDMNPTKVKHGKFDENFVLSCRIRACRSLKGFRLPPMCSRKERRSIESFMKSVLGMMQGDLEGCYYSHSSLTSDDHHHLVFDHPLFDEPTNRYFVSCGLSRDWPDARGIWHTKDRSVIVKVNEEDHIKIIAVESGGDIEKVYERFYKGLRELEKRIEVSGGVFMRNNHLGNITTCPSNLGTALRASVHVKLPHLGKDSRFPAILCALRLQKRGSGGLEKPIKDSVYDISNADRLGYTEIELVQKVIDGVNLLIKMEKRLERGQSLSDIAPFKL
ncbi:hypothetical protein QZH41_019185 [Actinostola sp. cb2023]|nr:hypothetical protein QZH41_019185 [Actinostola sp. cb2023]